MEEWKWVKYKNYNFINRYMVSNFGNIKSIDRINCRGQKIKGILLKLRDGSKKSKKVAYKVVTLWDNGKKIDIEVHRLVATMFVNNPNNYPCVNHIDGNPQNNNFNNLEWCTYKQNVFHSINVLGNNPKKWKSKKVLQYNLDNKLVNVWESAWEAQRQLGILQVGISRCCRGVIKTGIYKGFKWKFYVE